MSYLETIQEIKKKKYYPVHLLFGNESYLIQDLEHKIINSRIKDPEEGLNISTLDLDEVSIQEAVLDAETFPFFGEHKILILRNPSFFKATPDKTKVEHDLKSLEMYIENPVEYTTIIFIAPYEKLDERKKIVKKIKEHGKLSKCESPKEWEISKWIDLLARQMNIEIDSKGINVLVEEVGTDLMAMQKEIEKLSHYLGDEKRAITKEEIESLISRHTESTAFKMVDAVMKKQLNEAVLTFKELVKRKEEPIALLALFASQIRLILQCKLMKNKGYSSQQISKQVRAHPFAVKMALEREAHFSEEQLYTMISSLSKTDEQMKRGEMEKELAFEMLLHQLISVQVI